MSLDLEQIRNDTPSCKNKLFFNSAGSSLPPLVVNKTIIEYLNEEEKIGGYKLDEIRTDSIEGFYEEASIMLHCKPDNIAFTYNATDSYAKAISSIALTKGSTIITTDNDYISNFTAFISLKKRLGVQIIRMKNKEEADLDLEALLRALRDFGCAGRILCESPIMEEDALNMMKAWKDVSGE